MEEPSSLFVSLEQGDEFEGGDTFQLVPLTSTGAPFLDYFSAVPFFHESTADLFINQPNAHRSLALNTAITDFPQLSLLFQEAKEILYTFVKKLRRIDSPSSSDPFSRFDDTELPNSFTNPDLHFLEYSF